MSVRRLLLATIGLLAFIVVGFAGLAVANRGTDTPARFYLEASLRGLEMRLADSNESVPVGLLRWWYLPPGQWRWEIFRDVAGSDGDLVAAEFFDGERLWFQSGAPAVHCSVPFQPRGSVLLAPPLPLAIGPSSSASPTDLVKELEARSPTSTASISGTATALGRNVDLIEYKPASPGEPPTEQTVGRMGFDDARDFIMWHLVIATPAEDGGIQQAAEVMHLDYGESAGEPRGGLGGVPEGSREVLAGSTECGLAAVGPDQVERTVAADHFSQRDGSDDLPSGDQHGGMLAIGLPDAIATRAAAPRR